MTNPENSVSKSLEAEKVTGIRGGTGMNAQGGMAYNYMSTGGGAALLARGIRWVFSRFKRH